MTTRSVQPHGAGPAVLRDGDLRVEQDGYVRIVTFNRPEKLNALTREMLGWLGEIISAAGADESVRAVVFTGEGRAFCAGADVGGLKNSAETSLENRLASKRHFTPRHCDFFKPTICAVNGICAGAGLHFVADCDIVIASETAQFTDTHVNVGQVTAIEPAGLARKMPLGAVLRMVTLGRAERIDARRAYELNMVSEVLPPQNLFARAMELARIAASVSPAAVQASLKAVWGSFEPGLTRSFDEGYAAVMRHRDHPDAKEGPTAFLEKRAPVWRDN